MLIKFILVCSFAIIVNSELFPGTSCSRQPAGKQWFIKHATNVAVFYQCIDGKVGTCAVNRSHILYDCLKQPVRKSCNKIFCVCIGADCSLAESEKKKCAIKYRCPALTAVEKPGSCDPEPCLHRGVCNAVTLSRGTSDITCSCTDGHYGNKCEQDACNPDNCMEDTGTCKRMPAGQYICECIPSYSGKYCEIDDCVQLQCVSGHGYCKRFRNRSPLCVCNGGYKGEMCEIEVCKPKPCQHNGYCTRRKNELGYVCYCRRGYTGYNCETKRSTGTCEQNRCTRGSTCKDITGGHYCKCLTGFSGRYCDNDICVPLPCQNGGSCIRKVADYGCDCQLGFLGKSCEIDSCLPSPCRNSASCVRVEGDFRCRCLRGYTGKVCQIDECGINRCRNGGTCIRKLKKYDCSCMGGFHGDHCEYRDVTLKPYDPRGYFKCRYGYTQMTNVTGGLKDVEDCKTWCFIREDHISQTVRRGCWYPDLFNHDPVLYAEPMNGCGFFADNLERTDTGNDKVYCFCKSMDRLCNAGNIETVLKELPIIQRLV